MDSRKRLRTWKRQLQSMYYNFVRTHQSLKQTPAMAAGVTDHKWEVGDMIDLMEQARFEEALSK